MYQTELKIVALTKVDAHPRAIELENRKKREIALELKALEKTLTGQVVNLINTAGGQALKQKVEAAKKVTLGVRPKTPAASAVAGDQNPYMAMTLEEINAVIEEESRKQGVRV